MISLCIPNGLHARLLAVLVETLGVAAADGEATDRFTEHVFHHICENPRLPALLRPHPASPHAGENSEDLVTHCLIADHAIRGGRIYFELLPEPGIDQLWVIDAGTGYPLEGPARTLIRLTARVGGLLVESPSAGLRSIPFPPGEARLDLRFENGRFVLSGERSGRPPAGDGIEAPQGIFLLRQGTIEIELASGNQPERVSISLTPGWMEWHFGPAALRVDLLPWELPATT